MAIQDDFSVASNGDIRHVSGTTVYSVNAFHAWPTIRRQPAMT